MSFIVAGNWKMNKGPKEAREFFDTFKKIEEHSSLRKLFFVSAVNAPAAGLSLSGTHIGWGPQNFYPEANGAFTGETSPQVMKDLGAEYALIGHSERRSLFMETNEMVNTKVKAAQNFGLSPVVCIGETFKERKEGLTLDVLEKQLSEGLKDVEVKNQLHIAYEPVWAIGTGEVASVNQVSEAHQFIREFLVKNYPEHQKNMNILYGGSVKPGNSAELSLAKEVSGFLVGGASLKPDSFLEICKAVQG